MIKNLQVLRALAALLVAYYHFGFNNSKIGFFGVDIFFIISGFIMSFVLFKNQTDFFKAYYKNCTDVLCCYNFYFNPGAFMA